jgi:hypothetical protein
VKNWLENFTLYDLIGYFAVGLLTYLSFDLVWHWEYRAQRISELWGSIGDLKLYQAGLVAIVAYMMGQILGSVSQFFYTKILGVKVIPWHNYPAKAWSDWVGVRDRILPVYGGSLRGEDASEVFWLCVALSRAGAPVIYGDAFKWLVYSGASRTFSLVSLVLAVKFGFLREWYWFCALTILTLAFYYTFARMLKQYHRDVINSVLLVLNNWPCPGQKETGSSQ